MQVSLFIFVLLLLEITEALRNVVAAAEHLTDLFAGACPFLSARTGDDGNDCVADDSDDDHLWSSNFLRFAGVSLSSIIVVSLVVGVLLLLAGPRTAILLACSLQETELVLCMLICLTKSCLLFLAVDCLDQANNSEQE